MARPRTKGVMNNHLAFSIASQLAQMLQPELPRTQKWQRHHLMAKPAQSLANRRYINAHMTARR